MDRLNNSSAERLGTRAMNDLRLATARKRLMECSGRADAIEAVREIVSNFLGSEEMALLDFGSTGTKTLWSFGLQPQDCNLLASLGGEGFGRIARGECAIDNLGCDGASTTRKARAFVPIRVANKTVGVLAILQLLPQKSGFDAADMDLLKLLSIEAGRGLFDSEEGRASHESERNNDRFRQI